MAVHSPDVAALNRIAANLIDARRLYYRAMRVSGEPDTILAIQRSLDERTELLSRVQGRVRKLGGAPQTRGSALGLARTAALKLRAGFDHDLDAAIGEVARGEDCLRNEIRGALARPDLTRETTAFLAATLDGAASREIEAQREDLAHA
ncbi:MAG: DUF2383 domain-containing protein [Caulobacteraceae bacterium]